MRNKEFAQRLAPMTDFTFDIVAAFVPTRERLTVIERVNKKWYKRSSTGNGWRHNIDLIWLSSKTITGIAPPSVSTILEEECRPMMDWSILAKWLGERLSHFDRVIALGLPFITCISMLKPFSDSIREFLTNKGIVSRMERHNCGKDIGDDEDDDDCKSIVLFIVLCLLFICLCFVCCR